MRTTVFFLAMRLVRRNGNSMEDVVTRCFALETQPPVRFFDPDPGKTAASLPESVVEELRLQ